MNSGATCALRTKNKDLSALGKPYVESPGWRRHTHAPHRKVRPGPRIGAQFRVFVDDNDLDIARALYRDLSGQIMRRSRHVDGRIFVVEPHDLRASVSYFRRGELSADAWLRSFNGRKEFAWFSWDDPLLG
jgi:hypothetical protein